MKVKVRRHLRTKKNGATIVRKHLRRNKKKVLRSYSKAPSESDTPDSGSLDKKMKEIQGGFSDKVFKNSDLLDYLKETDYEPFGWLGSLGRTPELDKAIEMYYKPYSSDTPNVASFIQGRYGRQLGEFLYDIKSKTDKVNFIKRVFGGEEMMDVAADLHKKSNPKLSEKLSNISDKITKAGFTKKGNSRPPKK